MPVRILLLSPAAWVAPQTVEPGSPLSNFYDVDSVLAEAIAAWQCGWISHMSQGLWMVTVLEGLLVSFSWGLGYALFAAWYAGAHAIVGDPVWTRACNVLQQWASGAPAEVTMEPPPFWDTLFVTCTRWQCTAP